MTTKEDEVFIALLGEFFPVRADFMAGFLTEANKSEKTLDVGRERQLFNFIRLLTQNAEDLVQGYGQQRISKVAWAARNILEISIWVDYCNLSETHAKQFRDDSARDLLDFAKAVQRIVVQDHGAPDFQLGQKQEELKIFAQSSLGITGLDDDFTRVSEAAKTIGRQSEFLALNKLYSKYAHPTSIALNSVVAVWTDAEFRGMFLKDAVKHATDTLTTIREAIAKDFPQIDRAPVIGKVKRAA